MRSHLFFLALFLFSFSGYSAYAADVGGRNAPNALENLLSFKFSKSYDETLDRIYKTGKVNKFDMVTLRSHYPRTEQYVAFSDEILSKMTELSFTIKTSKDLDLVRRSAREYNTLVHKHFANMEVLFLAASLSKEDVRLGDSNLLKQASEALYDAAIVSNDGLTLRNAIKVVTFGEEDIILRRYGHGKLIKSDLYENGGGFVNIHQIKETKTGKITKLFFDVSEPINSEAKKQGEQEKIQKIHKF